MILGRLGFRMENLPKGSAVVILTSELEDAARYYMDSWFDIVRHEDVLKIINEINSDEYPGFSIQIIEGRFGQWNLRNCC